MIAKLEILWMKVFVAFAKKRINVEPIDLFSNYLLSLKTEKRIMAPKNKSNCALSSYLDKFLTTHFRSKFLACLLPLFCGGLIF
jgi:hypothetical protein